MRLYKEAETSKKQDPARLRYFFRTPFWDLEFFYLFL